MWISSNLLRLPQISRVHRRVGRGWWVGSIKGLARHTSVYGACRLNICMIRLRILIYKATVKVQWLLWRSFLFIVIWLLWRMSHLCARLFIYDRIRLKVLLIYNIKCLMVEAVLHTAIQTDVVSWYIWILLIYCLIEHARLLYNMAV